MDAQMNNRNLIVSCLEYIHDNSFQKPKLAMHYYGKVMSIIAESQPKPLTLRNASASRIKGRRVLSWNKNLGFAGMSSPGFFGIQLLENEQYPKEWLILTVWNSTFWLLFDGKRFDEIDNHTVSEELLEGEISEFEVCKDSTKMIIRRDNEINIEFPQDLSFLPKMHADLVLKWNSWENQADAWVLTQGELFC